MKTITKRTLMIAFSSILILTLFAGCSSGSDDLVSQQLQQKQQEQQVQQESEKPNAAETSNADADMKDEVQEWFDKVLECAKDNDIKGVAALCGNSETQQGEIQTLMSYMIEVDSKEYSEINILRNNQDGVAATMLSYNSGYEDDALRIAIGLENSETGLVFSPSALQLALCPTCGGGGTVIVGNVCPICSGTGQQYMPNVYYDAALGWQGQYQACSGCGGTGGLGGSTISSNICSACAGFGVVK